MRISQLIAQLQRWQVMRGDCDVLFQSDVGVSEEFAINGSVIAEDETGTLDIILFTNYGSTNGKDL